MSQFITDRGNVSLSLVQSLGRKCMHFPTALNLFSDYLTTRQVYLCTTCHPLSPLTQNVFSTL